MSTGTSSPGEWDAPAGHLAPRVHDTLVCLLEHAGMAETLIAGLNTAHRGGNPEGA